MRRSAWTPSWGILHLSDDITESRTGLLYFAALLSIDYMRQLSQLLREPDARTRDGGCPYADHEPNRVYYFEPSKQRDHFNPTVH